MIYIDNSSNQEQQSHVVPFCMCQVGSDLVYGDGQAGPYMVRAWHGLVHGAWVVVVEVVWMVSWD